MDLPALAKRTFEKHRDNPEFMGITQRVLQKLKGMADGIMRARYVHNLIDGYLKKLFEQPVVRENVTCKSGCNYCCHTQVSITEDEAQLLVKSMQRNKVKIDYDRLYKQAQSGNSASKWYSLPYEERKCVFLAKDGKCSVYEDRPSVCRTNYVLSPKEDCKTELGIEKPQRMLNTIDADMAVIAFFANSKDNGALPSMLVKAIRFLKMF